MRLPIFLGGSGLRRVLAHSFLEIPNTLPQPFAKLGELVRAKQLSAEKAFSYSLVREGELIREIVIRNVDEERLKELKSSIRWTLEKMYEKMKSA